MYCISVYFIVPRIQQACLVSGTWPDIGAAWGLQAVEKTKVSMPIRVLATLVVHVLHIKGCCEP